MDRFDTFMIGFFVGIMTTSAIWLSIELLR